jgi:hypothetical protein
MRNLTALLAQIVVTAVVATAMPALAQQMPHGAREFFAPEATAPPRVTPFAPHPADIYYENSQMQVFRDLPHEP